SGRPRGDGQGARGAHRVRRAGGRVVVPQVDAVAARRVRGDDRRGAADGQEGGGDRVGGEWRRCAAGSSGDEPVYRIERRGRRLLHLVGDLEGAAAGDGGGGRGGGGGG